MDMEFQRARTEKQIQSRKSEIIQACKEIHATVGYENVTIKAISEKISCTRPAIYTYFKTKEEIFLEILTEEYVNWTHELKEYFEGPIQSKEAFCAFLAKSLSNKDIMLELMSTKLNDIENGVQLKSLIEFKKQVIIFFDNFYAGLEKFFPSTKKEDIKIFSNTFFTYLYGLYPHHHHSDKQLEAMKAVHMEIKKPDMYQACLNALLLMSINLK